MVEKIISGGQTGVDRAALDAALETGIPIGGWCPKGRLAEDGTIPEKYSLNETPDSEYAQRTEWNVRDSDGTLILTSGKPTEGTALTVQLAGKLQKPFFIVDFLEKVSVEPVQLWFHEKNIKVLNVAGPRLSKNRELYSLSRTFLERLFQAQNH